MHRVFPLVTETSKIRGVVGLIKQNGGSIELSELAEEAEEHIDDLLPLIEACKVLGFATVDESKIRLTELGMTLNIGNTARIIKEKLVDIEPFYSTLDILKHGELTTAELLGQLDGRGVSLHGDRETNEALTKKMLMRLGVRTKLVYYDPANDVWSLHPFRKK
ncbi:MAG: AAA-associated domain-containing protein [Candidatus Marsarchaeota archaeon]|jgi:hypothetical protein|nr:AAA-associated domain-containing protein [Candidatus Marsarchaeota archaeon]